VFFFQAEDGIRDYKVTGVQTCALPIFPLRHQDGRAGPEPGPAEAVHPLELFHRDPIVTANRRQGLTGLNPMASVDQSLVPPNFRSGERRVGKEGEWRWWRFWCETWDVR